MTVRRGLGRGYGKGYRNIISRDPIIHSQSARGIKQPQRLSMHITAKPINSIIKNLKNFEIFKTGKYDEKYRNGHDVFRVGSTIIKDMRTDEDGAKKEAKIHNLLAERYDHPYATTKKWKDRWYVIVDRIDGNIFHGFIQDLPMKDKNELAEKTRYLYNKGWVDYDLRNRNLIDSPKGYKIFDFDWMENKYDPKTLEMQYNLNIISIFGLKSKAKNRFMTMTPRQLGLVL